jgi:hypothetical protein
LRNPRASVAIFLLASLMHFTSVTEVQPMKQKIIAIARTSLLVLGLAAFSGCYADHYRYGYSDPGYGYSPYSYSTLPPAYAYAPPAYRYDEEHHPIWHHEDREEHHARPWVHHHDDDDD